MQRRIPVLLDTDPGSDIDDALAIAYLARQPRCEFVGVTTVTGDTNQRAGIVEVVLRAYGREDVPIVAGTQEILGNGPGQPKVPHYAAIADRPHRKDYAPNQAVDYLRETIRARPGEIHLMSIGPLTNVALLFALDPEIPSLLAGFSSMLGHFGQPDIEEWNSRCDPAANEAVIRRTPFQTFFGLDVTMKCQLSPEEVHARFGKSPHNVVLPMAGKWFEHAGAIIFHDPLAAACLFEPDLCGYEVGTVRATGGRTDFVPGEGGPHRVATTVDPDRFFAHYFEVLG